MCIHLCVNITQSFSCECVCVCSICIYIFFFFSNGQCESAYPLKNVVLTNSAVIKTNVNFIYIHLEAMDRTVSSKRCTAAQRK